MSARHTCRVFSISAQACHPSTAERSASAFLPEKNTMWTQTLNLQGFFGQLRINCSSDSMKLLMSSSFSHFPHRLSPNNLSLLFSLDRKEFAELLEKYGSNGSTGSTRNSPIQQGRRILFILFYNCCSLSCSFQCLWNIQANSLKNT